MKIVSTVFTQLLQTLPETQKVTVRHKTVLAIAYNLWTIVPIQVSSKTITIT